MHVSFSDVRPRPSCGPLCCAGYPITDHIAAALAMMSGQDTDISNMGQGGEGAGKLGSAAANVAQVNLDLHLI
jgi:hypothetical protein